MTLWGWVNSSLLLLKADHRHHVSPILTRWTFLKWHPKHRERVPSTTAFTCLCAEQVAILWTSLRQSLQTTRKCYQEDLPVYVTRGAPAGLLNSLRATAGSTGLSERAKLRDRYRPVWQIEEHLFLVWGAWLL